MSRLKTMQLPIYKNCGTFIELNIMCQKKSNCCYMQIMDETHSHNDEQKKPHKDYICMIPFIRN